MVIRTNRSYRLPLSLAVAVGVFMVGIYSYTTLATSFSASREAEAARPNTSLESSVTEPSEPSARPAGLLGAQLYTDPSLTEAGRPEPIASTPSAVWLGDWSADVAAETDSIVSAASQQNKLAAFVLYNIPKRDCGLYSAGGADDSAQYRRWVDQFVVGLGQRPAIVILEPDALLQLDCLSESGQAARIADLNYAITSLASKTAAMTYVDAGNNTWKPADVVAVLLRQLELTKLAGFALNVSNFGYTKTVADYGDQIARQLGGLRYVIDTSRNGNGPAANNAWCNPDGRALGAAPTTMPDYGQFVDAYLWIKTPGESDGECNGGPAAGQWYEDYAQMLIANAAANQARQ